MKGKKQQGKIKKSVSPYMKYSGLAFQLAAMMMIGIFGGQWIDEYLGLETPIFTILLTIGLFIGFMYKLYLELLKD